MEDNKKLLNKTWEEYKKEGNDFFLKGHMKEAIEQYTLSIDSFKETDKNLAPIYSNRSLAQFKIENYGAALIDSEKAIEADPLFSKSYYRKSSCLFVLGKLKEAISALTYIQKKLEITSNKEVNDKIKYLKQLLKEKSFYECIQYEDEFDKLTPSTLTVEESYKGPVINREIPLTSDKVEELLEFLKDQKKIPKKYVWELCHWAIEVLNKESNVVNINVDGNNVERITVCGDIHGQYYDLLNIFKLNGFPSRKKPYLFNGDFVDRGSFSVEVIIALYLFKVMDPECIYLNRGNHENPDMNKLYGFEGEVVSKYCDKTFIVFKNSFYSLPLAHVLNKQVLVLHGGLFEKEGIKINDLNSFNRKIPIPGQGLMCDMLWADPMEENGRSKSQRGISIQFGPDIAKRFLDDNGLSCFIRIIGEISSNERRRI